MSESEAISPKDSDSWIIDNLERLSPSLAEVAQDLEEYGEGKIFLSSYGPQKGQDERPHFSVDTYVDFPGARSGDDWIIVEVYSAQEIHLTHLVKWPDDDDWSFDCEHTMTIENFKALLDQMPKAWHFFCEDK